MAFALIAANWAVHGTRTEILSNLWARWSLTVAVIYLASLLALIGRMIRLLRLRHEYADHEKHLWAQEFEQNATTKSPWPYTLSIQQLGKWMQRLHIFGPIASGILLAVSLFFGNPPTDKKTTSDLPNASKAAGYLGLEHLGEVHAFLAGEAGRIAGGDMALATAVERVAQAWISNRKQGKDGTLVIVGATDRLRLKAAEQERFDANVGLAEARGDEIRQKLIAALNVQAPDLAPKPDEVLVLTAGPSHVQPIEKCTSCPAERGYPDDRRVDIWALWGSPGRGEQSSAASK